MRRIAGARRPQLGFRARQISLRRIDLRLRDLEFRARCFLLLPRGNTTLDKALRPGVRGLGVFEFGPGLRHLVVLCSDYAADEALIDWVACSSSTSACWTAISNGRGSTT